MGWLAAGMIGATLDAVAKRELDPISAAERLLGEDPES